MFLKAGMSEFTKIMQESNLLEIISGLPPRSDKENEMSSEEEMKAGYPALH